MINRPSQFEYGADYQYGSGLRWTWNAVVTHSLAIHEDIPARFVPFDPSLWKRFYRIPDQNVFDLVRGPQASHKLEKEPHYLTDQARC